MGLAVKYCQYSVYDYPKISVSRRHLFFLLTCFDAVSNTQGEKNNTGEERTVAHGLRSFCL